MNERLFDAISRLTAWRRDFGDRNTVVFNDDIGIVLEAALRIAALERRISELEDGLRSAIEFVTPEVSDLVKEFSGVKDETLISRIGYVREKRIQLAALLAANDGPASGEAKEVVAFTV